MYASASPLSAAARQDLARDLDQNLADGLDLWSQAKVAHWNLRGPHFPVLHEFFDTLASSLSLHNDGVAERAVILGGRASVTARQAAGRSRLEEYPEDVTRDLDHAQRLAERIGVWLEGLRETRRKAESVEDPDTADLLTAMILEFEKHVWFLRATADA